MRGWLGYALLWASAVLHAAVPEFDDRRIGALPPAMRDEIRRLVLAGQPTQKQRLERIVDLVFDSRRLGMRYDEIATPTVAEALATRRANCLGFTLLFLALAREAGLEAHPRVIEETLSWHRRDGVFYRNSHINTQVVIGSRRYTLDVARDAVITRGEPERISRRQLLARFHDNRAMEALAAGDLAEARAHMERAIELEPSHPSHWSNAGVLALREGDGAAARDAYARALALDPAHGNTLFNLVGLARRDGERQREAEYRARLRDVQRNDPFHHFLQAIDHERAGDDAQAAVHYRRAIALHRRDARFHAALAAVLERLQDAPGARKAWARAAALARGQAREDYLARRRALPAG